MATKQLSNLANLQNLMKKDPQSYQDEFRQQLRHFQSSLQIFKLNSTKQSKQIKDFAALITFLAHVAPCFRQECANLPTELLDLLENNYDTLDPLLRRTLVQCLVMLQKKDLLSRLVLLPVLFKLFRCQDKQLRELLFNHIVSDIRAVNKQHKNHKLNNTLQNFMFTMLKDDNTTAAKKSLDVMVELWRRKVWVDAKCVNAIADIACFSQDLKIMCKALSFFLGVEQVSDDDEDEEELERKKSMAMKELMIAHSAVKGVKRKNKRNREMKRAAAKIKNADNKSSSGFSSDTPALHLLYDPQAFAERLFGALKKSAHSFDTRMLMMNVISRLIGAHKLIIENFYPFLQKYIQAHQRNVTQILAFLAQASHNLVPPDVLKPCVRTLANHFVSDRSSPEVMAVGLNAIREICARAPIVMDRELLHDLSQYKKSKVKGVMMASRSLIALFRELNPALLEKRERGRAAALAVADGTALDGTEAVDGLEFGAADTRSDVIGAELLMQHLEEQGDNPDDEDAWAVKPEKDNSDSDDDDEEDFEDFDFDSDVEDDEDADEQGDSKTQDMDEDEDNEDEDEDDDEEEEEEKQPKQALKGKGQKRKAESEEEDEDEDEDEDDEEGEEIDLDNLEGLEGDEGEEDEDEDEDEKGEEAGEQNGKEAKESGEATEKKKALPFGATRIFTPRDFEAIQKMRIQNVLGEKRHGKKSKFSRFDGSNKGAVERKEFPEEVDVESLLPPSKNKRKTKAERLASVHEGREEFKKEIKVKGGGSTNKEKLRLKPMAMVRAKNKRKHADESFKDRQKKTASHIKHLKQQAKSNHKKRRKI